MGCRLQMDLKGQVGKLPSLVPSQGMFPNHLKASKNPRSDVGQTKNVNSQYVQSRKNSKAYKYSKPATSVSKRKSRKLFQPKQRKSKLSKYLFNPSKH